MEHTFSTYLRSLSDKKSSDSALKRTGEKMVVNITEGDLIDFATHTDGYAGSDIVAIIEQAKNASFDRWHSNQERNARVLTSTD